MEREDDVQLIYNILSGDEEAFSVLVQKYQKSVHALVWRKIGDFHHAEEITQDIFLQVHKKLATLKDPHQFAGWLYVIANRFCISWIRKKKRTVQLIEDTPTAEIEKSAYTRYLSEQRQMEASECRREIVKKLLARLPESERTVVTLYYLGEMKVKEISKFLGVSVNTINTRLHRARKRLETKEFLVQEVLGSVQISENLIHNVMRQVPDFKPTPPSTTKPLVPWLAFGTAVILIALMLGASNQYLRHFQQPYSFEAQSEHTIEIIDALIVLDIDSKPDIHNQVGHDTPSTHNGNVGSQTSETLLTSTIGGNSKMHERNIELCTQNLITIGNAIQSYQKEHEDFPEWLSDLYPKYLADASVFICPADEEDGKTIFPMNTDPKLPVSYGYQFHPEYREEKSKQREVYGDAMPLVRCRHHPNEDFSCLNLSFSSKIYKSSAVWEFTPEDLYGSPEAAITAFEDTLAQHPDAPRFSEVYPQLIRLYTKVGNEQSANALIERLKSGTTKDIDGYRMLFDVLVMAERYEDMLEIFKTAEQQHPDAQPIHSRLAYIYRKLGNTELADVYDRKADPTYELWGKPVTDFSTTDLDGNPISLQDYRGKVVLLDFWGVWCGFCINEMPNLKKVYDTYKDQGFDIVGISLDDEESALRDYIQENDIQWRQIYSGERWKDDPLAQQYKITGVPSQWLIDGDGKLISHKARGEGLEPLVVEALKNKSADR